MIPQMLAAVQTTALDWAFVVGMLVFTLVAGLTGRRYMKSVSDFLAAGRSAGRYMMAVSGSMAAVGAISIVNFFQMNYEAGFALAWWDVLSTIAILLVAASGWVRYRFRRTRCLTLAEFFERRYSRGFRVFAGMVGFAGGLLNFGIFPAVGTMFFMQFMGLSETLTIFGSVFSTYHLLMLGLIGVALLLVLAGGQVSVLITDFFQGAYANIIFVVVTALLLLTVPWDQVGEVLTNTEHGHSKINPFDTSKVKSFNFAFAMIGIAGIFYNAMSWQGEQAYNASATSAHETKMAQMLGIWRDLPRWLLCTIVPILCFVVLQHSGGENVAVQQAVNADLAAIDNPAVQSQMRVPLTLARLLPVGLLGAFGAMMLAAFVSTHNTYLHSWASMFIQDVVLPIRGRPLGPRAHMLCLRLGIIGVAFFIYLFSVNYSQNQEIMMYMALTGSVFASWSGAVLIGGLYWSRGNRFGAWLAGISGVTWTLAIFALTQMKGVLELLKVGSDLEDAPTWALWLAQNLPNAEGIAEHLPNGQEAWGLGMLICPTLYVIGSLARPSRFDLQALLNRGIEAGDEELKVTKSRSKLSHFFGISDHFTLGDAWIYRITYAWTAMWILAFVVISLWVVAQWAMSGVWPDNKEFWLGYWKTSLWIRVVASAIVTVAFLCGGIGDLKRMLGKLKSDERDEHDDGFVETSAESNEQSLK